MRETLSWEGESSLSLSPSRLLSFSRPLRPVLLGPPCARSLSPRLSPACSRLSVPLTPSEAHAPGLIANIISGSSHKRGRSYLNDCLGVLTTPIVYEVDLGAARGKSSETHC